MTILITVWLAQFCLFTSDFFLHKFLSSFFHSTASAVNVYWISPNSDSKLFIYFFTRFFLIENFLRFCFLKPFFSTAWAPKCDSRNTIHWCLRTIIMLRNYSCPIMSLHSLNWSTLKYVRIMNDSFSLQNFRQNGTFRNILYYDNVLLRCLDNMPANIRNAICWRDLLMSMHQAVKLGVQHLIAPNLIQDQRLQFSVLTVKI